MRTAIADSIRARAVMLIKQAGCTRAFYLKPKIIKWPCKKDGFMYAKANQLEPYRYLRYLLEQLPLCRADEQRELLFPQHCKAILQAVLK